MGGAASTDAKAVSQSLRKPNEQKIVKLMMPVYYNGEKLDAKERKEAFDSWQMILDDKSPEFVRNKGKEGFPYASCVTFFYDTFYTRLFDIHPMSRGLFKSGMRSQGKFLVKMISLALSELDDPEKFDRNLVKLAEIHHQRGVKAVECKSNLSLSLKATLTNSV